MLGNRKFVLESSVGIIVAVLAMVLLYYFMNGVEVGFGGKPGKCYTVNIIFNSVDGVTKGSYVKISGVTIGKVINTSLEQDYNAMLVACIDKAVSIPIDSTASIVRDGLISTKHIKVDPGASEIKLKDGDYIKNTQSAINFESLIGKFIFGKNNS